MSFSNYHALLFLLALSLTLSACNRKLQSPVDAKDFKVVGYLHSNNVGRIDEVPLSVLTHLDLAFANPDRDGNLVFPGEQYLSKVVSKAHQAGVKVCLSIAGGRHR